MFSPKIVASDAFLDMPTSSRELYFQLGMYADDDGFVNPKKIIRMVGASEDDLKVLIGKRFVIPFDNGVVVIKHWAINNLIRKDFHRDTVYIEQKNMLIIKENGAYTEAVNKMLTSRQRRISVVKDSVVKDSVEIPSPSGDAPSAQTPKSEYGNPTINALLASLRGQNGGVIDGSERENRRYAHLLLGKLKSIVKNGSVEDGAMYVLAAARESSFHSKNATSMKYIYNNLVKIIAEKKNNKYQINV